MAQAKLHAANGEFKSKIELPADLFDAEVSQGSMYLAIQALLTNARQGTSRTKTRSEVSGGGKKPWKQKGTGRARAGSNTSSIWVRGNKAHGPKVVDYFKKINKKVKQRAFRSALTVKAQNEQIVVFEKLSWESPRTKDFLNIISKSGLATRNTLVLVGPTDTNLTESLRNVPWARSMRVSDVNTYELIRAGNVVLSQEALGALTGGNR